VPVLLVNAVIATIFGGSKLLDALSSASNSAQPIVFMCALTLCATFCFFWVLYREAPPKNSEAGRLEFKDLGDLCAFASIFFFALALAFGVVWAVLNHYHAVQYYGMLFVSLGTTLLAFSLAGIGALYRFKHPR
jgi:hypothetical protein